MKKVLILAISFLLLVPSFVMASNEENQATNSPTTKHEVMQKLHKEYNILPSETPPSLGSEDYYAKQDPVELDKFEKIMRQEIEKIIKVNKETDEKIKSLGDVEWVDVPTRAVTQEDGTTVFQSYPLVENQIMATVFYKDTKTITHGYMTVWGAIENSLGFWRFVVPVNVELEPQPYYIFVIPIVDGIKVSYGIDAGRTLYVRATFDVYYNNWDKIGTVNEIVEFTAHV
ncbi:hypothetical protein [Desulfitobacterium chlororespirans]|uniref:Uncharacterized protein n=1 Tax=Desulfitobacterium chlororespirans DSM 11544 TaxID=1121395 RepID=A0A1M7U6V3_9FIRM|nr:hypothetical protein [Desulfitobacterium chlororespirans]SHN78751.1 hypothetical protein SAMN02745215_03129 [Desulfitobacterium chlororespirans DSM 11544]